MASDPRWPRLSSAVVCRAAGEEFACPGRLPGRAHLPFVHVDRAVTSAAEIVDELDDRRAAPVASPVEASSDGAALIDDPGLGEKVGPKLREDRTRVRVHENAERG